MGTGELLTTLEALQELVSDGFVGFSEGSHPKPLIPSPKP